jgi:hypothetical protein
MIECWWWLMVTIDGDGEDEDKNRTFMKSAKKLTL